MKGYSLLWKLTGSDDATKNPHPSAPKCKQGQGWTIKLLAINPIPRMKPEPETLNPESLYTHHQTWRPSVRRLPLAWLGRLVAHVGVRLWEGFEFGGRVSV